MKKLSLQSSSIEDKHDFFEIKLAESNSKKEFVDKCQKHLVNLTIEFYDYIGILLGHIGFQNPHVTREGDTNCRMDAIIIDPNDSIPIEIKSPREVMEVNIKSIRQAFENKIVILSRKFYNSSESCTSLVIAYQYPADRSDVSELIYDIKNAFGYNIGMIDIKDLLAIMYDVKVNNKSFNFNYFNHLQGKFEYEKAFVK